MSHPGPNAPAVPGGWRWQDPRTNTPVQLARHDARPAQRAGARLHWPRTLAAKGPQRLQQVHLRHAPPPLQAPVLHLIALDTSGSMHRGGRLGRAKGYAASLIEQAARAGEHVALLGFGGQGVVRLLPPGPARAAGVARVRPLGGGGGTPLSAALAEAERLLRQAQRRRAPGGASCLWLLTDGHSLEQPATPASPDRVVIVDFDDPQRPIGRCATWAARWRAEHRLP